MRRGAASVNPRGRPPVGLALSNAVRARFPPDVIVSMAAHILEGDAPADIKLGTLEFLAKRGYGAIASLATTRQDGERADLEGATSAELGERTTCSGEASAGQTLAREDERARDAVEAASNAEELSGELYPDPGEYRW